MSSAPCRLRRSRDRGSISVFFTVVALGLLALIGLVYDGGLAQATRAEATAIAAEAARAGAAQIDPWRAGQG